MDAHRGVGGGLIASPKSISGVMGVRFQKDCMTAPGRLRSNDPPRRTAGPRSTAATDFWLAAVGNAAAAELNRINAGDRPTPVLLAPRGNSPIAVVAMLWNNLPVAAASLRWLQYAAT